MQRIIVYILLFPFEIVVGQKADLSLLQAKAEVSTYNYSEAIRTLSASKISNKTELYKLKAYCYFQTEKIQQAINTYAKADSITPNSSNLEIAKCYASLSESKSATQWLEKYLKSKNKLSEYEITSDKTFDLISNSSDWKELWKKEWYTASDIEKSSIKALIKRENWMDALNHTDINAKIITPKYELHYLQALIYKGLKQIDAAIASINLAINGNNRNEQYFLTKSELLKEKKNYSESVKNTSLAIEINPNEPAYYLMRAEAARLAGNYTLAQNDLNLYQNLFPENTETLYQLGMLESKKGNYLSSIEYFSKLIQKVQSNPDYYIERGDAAYKAERYQMSDEDMAAALDINPSLEKANLIKGKLRLYFLDTQGACYYFEKAAKTGNREANQLFNENCQK